MPQFYLNQRTRVVHMDQGCARVRGVSIGHYKTIEEAARAASARPCRHCWRRQSDRQVAVGCVQMLAWAVGIFFAGLIILVILAGFGLV